MNILDWDDTIDQKIWSKMEEIIAFDIYQNISEFIISEYFNTDVPFRVEEAVWYSVAPYLKRYLAHLDQWFFSYGDFLVWGRRNKDPLHKCPIIQEIVKDRLTRKDKVIS